MSSVLHIKDISYSYDGGRARPIFLKVVKSKNVIHIIIKNNLMAQKQGKGKKKKWTGRTVPKINSVDKIAFLDFNAFGQNKF